MQCPGFDHPHEDIFKNTNRDLKKAHGQAVGRQEVSSTVNLFIYLNCMCVSEYLCATCMHMPTEAEEGIRSLGAGAVSIVDHLTCMLRTELRPSEKQEVS